MSGEVHFHEVRDDIAGVDISLASAEKVAGGTSVASSERVGLLHHLLAATPTTVVSPYRFIPKVAATRGRRCTNLKSRISVCVPEPIGP